MVFPPATHNTLTTMIITRKIEVFICEDDKNLRKSYYEKLYDNRNIAQKVANMAMSHLFALDNTMPYLSDEDKDTITFLGVKGTPATKQNAPYVAASNLFKGQADMGMLSCVLQNAQKMYQDDRKQGMWNKSLRSYKANMPIPFMAERFLNLRFAEYDTENGKEGCFFTLMGIPFQMKFGRDRSGNRLIVERVISGEYKMSTSCIKCDGNKIFLLLCVDIPKKEVTLQEGKKMYAFLGVMNPIVCTCDVKATKEYDSGMKVWEIGTAEEFNHRRRQIQEACRRCQIENRYSVGGKGRQKKCKAIDRFHEKENNYVDTKLHTYSRMLIDMAVRHQCSEIVLTKELHREKKAKQDNAKENKTNHEEFVLRNWSYYGLKTKIDYKAKMVGIKVSVEK